MRKATSRRGSALLIVLGMLSFMVVSAIGFAAYMRYSRLPSSYLRRTSASRMLAKAAVAQAIDSVDIAVNNNLHPNIGFKWVSGDRQTNGEDQNRTRNYWFSRVLFGTNDVANLCASDPDSIDSAMPLCLEALAYLPPPLVNDVRYYGKLTPTSQWKPFGFDVGRFSFLAVDVSDYFDINRLSADLPRSSSPASRISLAYLFERGEEHTGPGDGATQWDQFMEQFRTLDQDTLQVDFNGKYPLVSLADFNLALGRRGTVGRFNSPFYDYIKTGGAGAGFYATKDEESEDRIRRMTFVTDGWFPKGRSDWSSSDGGSSAAADEDDLLDLNDGNRQPFKMSLLATLSGKKPNLTDTLMGMGMQDREEWQERIARIGCAALFDYLDTDHVPLSLALPVTERAPMICGISPRFVGSKFGVTKTMSPEGDEEVNVQDRGDEKTWRVVEKTVSYKINGGDFVTGFMGGRISALTAFPFSHPDELDGEKFMIEGRFSMFFSTAEMSLRTGNPNDVLHLDSPDIDRTEISSSTGLMSVMLGAQQIQVQKDILSEEDAVQEVDGLRLDEGRTFATYFMLDGNELLTVTYRWKQTKTTNAGGAGALGDWGPKFAAVQAEPGKYDAEVTAKTAFKALKADGNVDDKFASELADKVKVGDGPDVWLNAAVWLLVKSGNNVVDMVPACLFDDKIMNNVPDATQIYTGLGPRLGTAGPLFRFDTGVKFKLSIAGLEELASKPQDMELSPKIAVVADPRFNYAPESWFSVSGDALTKEFWLQSNQTGFEGRDSDIFMATSDAGYMQSKYELAMLPRFTKLLSFGTDSTIGNLESPANFSGKSIPASFKDALNHDFMWRTYDPFDIDEDAFDELPWTSEGTGFKVNPYSDNRNVLMAAFANTPMDWKRASTNIVPGVKDDFSSLPAADFNKKYAWNAYADNAGNEMSWSVLEKIADNYMARIKANGQKDQNLGWTDAWQEMDWFGDDSSFCGATLDGDTKLWLADRKFFYGYWRDCFAAKQQLYMVFVRAEPMMMGGDSGALAPPQLSARAMALVWRDPCRVRDDKYPHQTRILFYRQFE